MQEYQVVILKIFGSIASLISGIVLFYSSEEDKKFPKWISYFITIVLTIAIWCR